MNTNVKRANTKLVVIGTTGPIPELGGISGPISSPSRVEVSTLIRMVNARRVVYEVNPKDYDQKVRLTVSNVTRDNFVEDLDEEIRSTKSPLNSVTRTKKKEDKSSVFDPDDIDVELTGDFTKIK